MKHVVIRSGSLAGDGYGTAVIPVSPKLSMLVRDTAEHMKEGGIRPFEIRFDVTEDEGFSGAMMLDLSNPATGRVIPGAFIASTGDLLDIDPDDPEIKSVDKLHGGDVRRLVFGYREGVPFMEAEVKRPSLGIEHRIVSTMDHTGMGVKTVDDLFFGIWNNLHHGTEE